MGRASSSKKVARAARVSGKRGAPRNFLWPAVMGLVVLVGVALIVVSLPDGADATPPRIGDHWHAPVGVYLCGEFEPSPVEARPDACGIHTNSDGLIHIEPFSSAYTGRRANLGAFAEYVAMEIGEDSLKLAGREELENGDDCGGSPGRVQVKVWSGTDDTEGRILEGDPSDYALQDGDIVTIAFVSEGADVPQPPSVGTSPTAGEQTEPTTDPGVPVESTVPPTESTESTVPGETTETTAPPTETTVAP